MLKLILVLCLAQLRILICAQFLTNEYNDIIKHDPNEELDHLALMNEIIDSPSFHNFNTSNPTQNLPELVKTIYEQAMAAGIEEYPEKYKPGHRRFLNWLKGLLNKKPTTQKYEYVSPTTTTTKYEQLTGVPDKLPELDDTSSVQKFLVAVLINLTQVIEKLNKNLELQNGFNPDAVQPLSSSFYNDNGFKNRRKREIAPKIVEITNTEVYSGTTAAADPSSEFSADAQNATSEINVTPTPSTQDYNKLCSSNDTFRRSYSSNPEIKNKLLTYLNDTFAEIVNKISPVKKVKLAYANNDTYRIGYLIANIDTLEVNIQNLKTDMEKHHIEWEDAKILDMFDKLMISNKVMTGLIESLSQMEHKHLMRNNRIPDHGVLPLNGF